MATGSWPTIVDVANRMDPDGKVPVIARMLSQSNDYAGDLPWVMANEMTSHQFVFETSIPAGTWRQYNQGVPYSKNTTAKARVSMGMLEDYSQIDRALGEHSGDLEGFRYSSDRSFLMGMGQTIAQTFFYGNTVANPAEFMGLSPFYNTVNTATAQNAANVLDGGGTGSNNCSFWLVGWSPKTIFGIYPRGSKAGLDMENKGDTTPGFDSLGNRFEAYTSWFRQQAGLCPMDWRYAMRCANVDVTNAGLAGPNALDMFLTMDQMQLLAPTMTGETSGVTETDDDEEPAPRWVWYGNRTWRHWLDVQMLRNRNVLIQLSDYAGKPCMGYRGQPIKIVDQLVNTESRVV